MKTKFFISTLRRITFILPAVVCPTMELLARKFGEKHYETTQFCSSFVLRITFLRILLYMHNKKKDALTRNYVENKKSIHISLMYVHGSFQKQANIIPFCRGPNEIKRPFDLLILKKLKIQNFQAISSMSDSFFWKCS